MAARGQKGDNSSLCLTLKLHQSGRKKPASIFVFTFDALLQLSRLGCDGPDAITDMPPHTHTLLHFNCHSFLFRLGCRPVSKCRKPGPYLWLKAAICCICVDKMFVADQPLIFSRKLHLHGKHGLLVEYCFRRGLTCHGWWNHRGYCCSFPYVPLCVRSDTPLPQTLTAKRQVSFTFLRLDRKPSSSRFHFYLEFNCQLVHFQKSTFLKY